MPPSEVNGRAVSMTIRNNGKRYVQSIERGIQRVHYFVQAGKGICKIDRFTPRERS